jgi:hypothetical protein
VKLWYQVDLSIGAFEQHGPSLPLVPDTLIAIAITEAISQRHKVFRLPAITFGCSHEHLAFPGTISLSPATLAAVVTDICTSLAQQGTSALIVVPPKYSPCDGMTPIQVIRPSAWARRSLPDGVFGIIPGSSTTTLQGRTSTSANTSCAT